MAQKLGLALVFLTCLYAGFWITAAPFAVAIKLVWWNEPIGPAGDFVLGCLGLAGGLVLAVLATRMVARNWSES